MASKIKNEKYINYTVQREQIHAQTQLLESLINEEKEHYQAMLLDVEEFLNDNFDSQTRYSNFSVVKNPDNLQLIWSEPQIWIKFYGHGKWSYELKKLMLNHEEESMGRQVIQFEGQAKPHATKDGKAYYNFYLDSQTDKALSKKEQFVFSYEPVYRLHPTRRDYTGQISYGWTGNYYDGPLSGYCYIKGELHYFDMEEESDFGRERMYAIYKLDTWEKIKAYYRHFMWECIWKNGKRGWKFYLMKLRLMNKIKDKIYGKERYKIERAKQDKWKKSKTIIAYWQY